MGRIYTEEQKENRRKAKREWYQKNKTKVSIYNKEYSKKYREKNKEELNEKKKEYYSDPLVIQHKNEYNEQYYKTKIGRASNLANSYSQMDKISGREECTITKEWIVENIFSSKCIYCGEDDWTKLGCDRIDNSKPHTPDNVVCSCGKCNKQRKDIDFEEFKIMLGVKNP